MSKIDPIKLSSLIDEGEKKVINTSLDISLNELANMATEGELTIDPDYQRVFQWEEGTRSRFIESLLLELPVPPIFAVEESSGKYSLVDGLQRISSYLHFRGLLQAEQFDPPVIMGDYLVLSGCDIVPELNGLTYNDLPVDMQIRVKRSFLRMEVIRKSSDPLIKYHMFKRLNSEGKPLSDQQKRNSSLRMLDNKFIEFLARMSDYNHFENTIASISEDKTLSWYDRELILRFIAMKNRKNKFKHDIREFLNEYSEDVALADSNESPIIDYKKEEKNFKKVFKILDLCLGEKAFAFKNKKNDNFSGFSVLQFEAIALGLEENIEDINKLDEDAVIDHLKPVFIQIKIDPTYINLTSGGGKNSGGLFRERVRFVSNRIKESLDDLLQS